MCEIDWKINYLKFDSNQRYQVNLLIVIFYFLNNRFEM
jgi:hypothetical protein